jgi:hypothetical protein
MSMMMLSFPFLMKRLLRSSGGGGPCLYLSDPTLDTTSHQKVKNVNYVIIC